MKRTGKRPPIHLEARLRGKKAEIVRVNEDGTVKVVATLPGKMLRKEKGETKRLGLDSDKLGRRLEKAFRLAVQHATQR